MRETLRGKTIRPVQYVGMALLAHHDCISPAGNYKLKVRARCKICLKLTIKTPERRQIASVSVTESAENCGFIWSHLLKQSGVVLVSLLITLNIFHTLL